MADAYRTDEERLSALLDLRAQGHTIDAAAKQVGLSYSKANRLLKRHDASTQRVNDGAPVDVNEVPHSVNDEAETGHPPSHSGRHSRVYPRFNLADYDARLNQSDVRVWDAQGLSTTHGFPVQRLMELVLADGLQHDGTKFVCTAKHKDELVRRVC